MKKSDIKQLHKRDTLQNFEAQCKKATLPLMILKILSEKEMYAYEIVQEALNRSNGTYKMPLLYTSINKLQEDGYVTESRKTISEANRVRIYYKITPEGVIHLKHLKNIYSKITETVISIVYDDEWR